jgi:glutathione synthase/RimK-type ligase-like ATP-grasp enzyme
MKIALIAWEEDSIDEKAGDEINLLQSYIGQKHEVIKVLDKEELGYNFDAALMRIPDYIDCSEAETLAWKIWDMGVPFLIDPLARRLARNKLYTQRLFTDREIRQPLWSMNPGDLSGEVVSKPLCGGRSMDVIWHKCPPAKRSGHIFQEYRKPLALWRSIASPDAVVLSYKKISEEKIISVSSGAERKILPASHQLEEMSRAMASALGGVLWGLDIIEDEKGLWALEANMNFGYPLEHAQTIAGEITNILEKKATP